MRITHSKYLFSFIQSAVLLLMGALATAANAGDGVDASLQALAEGEHRSADNKARNQFRHPVETLSWLGIKPNMTVIEIYPGAGGWYTEILGPYLRDHGQFYAASFDAESDNEFLKKGAQKFLDKLAANPELYDKIKVTELAPPNKVEISPAGSADMVLTFRNVHNWMRFGTTEDVFKSMYNALKPGGVMGVIEHRGNPEITQDPQAKSGYVNQQYVIELAELIGFKFEGSSEINANSKDTRDHPKGVWTLPPSYRQGDKDREKYTAIGESDRMTLKFTKPVE